MRLTNAANDLVFADAIRIERLGDLPGAPLMFPSNGGANLASSGNQESAVQELPAAVAAKGAPTTNLASESLSSQSADSYFTDLFLQQNGSLAWRDSEEDELSPFVDLL